eukprot:5427131-Pyramimonas_sp.AAC.1
MRTRNLPSCLSMFVAPGGFGGAGGAVRARHGGAGEAAVRAGAGGHRPPVPQLRGGGSPHGNVPGTVVTVATVATVAQYTAGMFRVTVWRAYCSVGMGDTLALQYGGSGAHNHFFQIHSKGLGAAAAHSREMLTSVRRFYNNTCAHLYSA